MSSDRSGSKVVQFTEARKEKQEFIRREYERILFNRILGAYTVIEKLGLKPVEMRDISKSGCGFRTPYEDGAFTVGEEIDFRFYFSHNTFVPIKLKIKRVAKVTEGSVSFWEYGTSFDTEMSTYPAVEKFVDFVNAYAALAKEDRQQPNKPIWF